MEAGADALNLRKDSGAIDVGMRTVRALSAYVAMLWFPVAGVAATVAALPGPNAGSPVLVISPPFGRSAAVIVAAAGGYPVGLATPPVGVIAHSSSPSFLTDLKSAGAILLLDAASLPRFLCGANV